MLKKCLFFIAICFPFNATSSTFWDWSVNNTAFIAGPNEEIAIEATLTNLTLSDEPLSHLDGDIELFGFPTPRTQLVVISGGPFPYSLAPFYPVEFRSQFAAKEILPGESLSFVALKLVPNGTGAALGIYEISPSLLIFGVNSGLQTPGSRTLTISVVPLSRSLVFFVSGILCLWLACQSKILSKRSTRPARERPFSYSNISLRAAG